MKKLLLLSLIFVAVINCQAQNNRYHLQVDNSRYDSKSFIEQLERGQQEQEQWLRQQEQEQWLRQQEQQQGQNRYQQQGQNQYQPNYQYSSHTTQKNTYDNYSSNYNNIPDCYTLGKLLDDKTALSAFLQSKGFECLEENTDRISLANLKSGVCVIEKKEQKTAWFFPDMFKSKIKSDLAYFARYNKNIVNGNDEFQVYDYADIMFQLSIMPVYYTLDNEPMYALFIIKLESSSDNSLAHQNSAAKVESKKAFNSYVQAAYNDYREGRYQSARKYLTDAYRIYEEDKLELTEEESKNYNTLNDMLANVDEYHPTFKIYPTDIVKEYPDFEELEDDNIIIKKVIISDDKTIIEVSNKNTGYAWMTISPDTYININGKKYNLTKTEGIGIFPRKTYFSSVGQIKDFALYFPAIPKTTEKIDLIEPGDSSWKFFGIKLK